MYTGIQKIQNTCVIILYICPMWKCRPQTHTHADQTTLRIIIAVIGSFFVWNDFHSHHSKAIGHIMFLYSQFDLIVLSSWQNVLTISVRYDREIQRFNHSPVVIVHCHIIQNSVPLNKLSCYKNAILSRLPSLFFSLFFVVVSLCVPFVFHPCTIHTFFLCFCSSSFWLWQ